jgi:hypothetical protein
VVTGVPATHGSAAHRRSRPSRQPARLPLPPRASQRGPGGRQPSDVVPRRRSASAHRLAGATVGGPTRG